MIVNLLLSWKLEGTILTGTGWGNISTEGQYYPDKLMQIKVPLLSNETWNLPASYDGNITDPMICVGNSEGGLIEKTVMIVNNGDSETKLYTFFFKAMAEINLVLTAMLVIAFQ